MAFVANDNQQLTLTDGTLNLTQKKGKNMDIRFSLCYWDQLC